MARSKDVMTQLYDAFAKGDVAAVSDDDVMRRCAEECRRCAESCERMAGAAMRH